MRLAPVRTPPSKGPAEIVRLVTAYRGARVLTAAVYLGVFDRLQEAPLSAAGLARALKADPRALEILLDALVPLGFLGKSGGLYSNSELSRRYLLRGAPGSLAGNLRYQELLAPAWADLPATVLKGRPSRDLSCLLSGEPEFTLEYIRGMSEIAGRPARELAEKLELAPVHDALDVGGGPGSYALALLERHPKMRVTILDLQSTLDVASAFWRSSPHAPHIRAQAGDYHGADWGRAAYDLVLMSHVTHDEGEEDNRALIAKAFRALRPGGSAVVHDFMLEPGRTEPGFAALFSVHMMVYTRKGRVYTAEEYEGWLREAGFVAPRRIPICPKAENASRAILVTKP